MERGVLWEAMGGAHIQWINSQCRMVTVNSTDEFGHEAVLVGRVILYGDFCCGVTTLHKANEQFSSPGAVLIASSDVVMTFITEFSG